MALRLRADRRGRILLDVRVAPRASRDRVMGEHDGALKVSVTAPPVDGAANAAILKLVAKALGVPKSSIELVGGQRSKLKTLAIEGVDEEKVQRLG